MLVFTCRFLQISMLRHCQEMARWSIVFPYAPIILITIESTTIKQGLPPTFLLFSRTEKKHQAGNLPTFLLFSEQDINQRKRLLYHGPLNMFLLKT